MRTFVPGRASGVLFKSKTPNIALQAEILGLIRHGRSRFKVIPPCIKSLSHSLAENFGSVLHSHAIK